MASAGWNPAPLNTSPSVPSPGSHTAAAIGTSIQASAEVELKAKGRQQRKQAAIRGVHRLCEAEAAQIGDGSLIRGLDRHTVPCFKHHAIARRSRCRPAATLAQAHENWYLSQQASRSRGWNADGAHARGFSLRDDKGRDVPLRSRKARALMGYLLVSGGVPERREKLASLLWSESTTEQAFDSLRHCISELRRAERSGGFPFLEADRDTIRIDRAKVRTDLDELKARLSSGEIAACRQLLTQPQLALLAGTEADDPVFDNWLMVERERQGEALVNDMLGVSARARSTRAIGSILCAPSSSSIRTRRTPSASTWGCWRKKGMSSALPRSSNATAPASRASMTSSPRRS